MMHEIVKSLKKPLHRPGVDVVKYHPQSLRDAK